MKYLFIIFTLFVGVSLKSSAEIKKEWVTIDTSSHFLSSGQLVSYSIPSYPRKVFELRVYYAHREAGAVMEITTDGGIYSRIEDLGVGGGTYMRSAVSPSGVLSSSVAIKNVGFEGQLEIQAIEAFLGE